MLTGKLVRLRAFEPSDAEALYRWNSDPDVLRWMVNDYPESLAQLTKRLGEEGRERERFRRDGKWHDLIVMSLLEGELVED